MSTETGSSAVVRAEPVGYLYFCAHWASTDLFKFLWFPCGIVRGALAAMGINATVQAETSELPAAIFQIKTVPTK